MLLRWFLPSSRARSCIWRCLIKTWIWRMTSWAGHYNTGFFLWSINRWQILISPFFNSRLRIDLKDIIDAQYADQVGRCCTLSQRNGLCLMFFIFSAFFSVSGTPWVMWSLGGFTSCSSGFRHPQKQTDWTKSAFSHLVFNHSWLLRPKSDSSCLILSLFPVCVGSPVLLQTVFPKQGRGLCRSALCFCWAGIWLTG